MLAQNFLNCGERGFRIVQRRGIFRKEYEGPTLRDNLGLPRPDNRTWSNSVPSQSGLRQ